MNTPHFDAAMGYRGRNDGPDILLECWHTMPEAERPDTLAYVWSLAEWPERYLGTDIWVTWFRSVGFVSEAGQPAPVEPLQLYRGSTWGRRRGMAWTSDLDRARWFADRTTRFGLLGHGGTGHVFGAVVSPAGVLAYIDRADGRGEGEIIVDPAYLPPIRRSSIIPPAAP